MKANPFRILIVDDDPLNSTTLVDIFNLNGYEVNAASSASEALKILNNQHHGVVIADIRMPVMNGVELLRNVKSRQPDVLFILMTAYADDDLLSEGIQEGALVIMLKPLNIEGLLFHVSKLADAYWQKMALQ